ncbi:cytochrome P450 monooxygenase 9 [Globomyces sp. JEL0801]|nr:cytochrome P450 monooxygenase 9 [Globomyces sp. JEL0801]
MTLEVPEGYIALDDTNNVYKRIITEGSGQSITKSGCTVKVHYTGSLYSNGEVFDSSIERGDPISFKLGTGQVIKGWDVGIATMKVGEHSELFIRSDYGYGKAGSPPKIPGDSILIFKVELSTADLTIAEKLSRASVLKDEGNTLFKTQKFDDALKTYKQAADLLSNTFGAESDESEQIKNLKINLYSNLAAVYLKIKDGLHASEYSQKVLDIDSTHSKAIFRLAQSKVLMNEFDNAIELYNLHKNVLKDLDVDQEILKVKKIQAHQVAAEKKYTNESVWDKPEGVEIKALAEGNGETIRASHLLVKHSKSRNPSSWKQDVITISKEEAIEKIKGFRERIEKGEVEFSALAMIESDCSSAKRGGDLNTFGRGQMQVPFETAAFGLKVGELSGVVESDSGIHLILRTA